MEVLCSNFKSLFFSEEKGKQNGHFCSPLVGVSLFWFMILTSFYFLFLSVPFCWWNHTGNGIWWNQLSRTVSEDKETSRLPASAWNGGNTLSQCTRSENYTDKCISLLRVRIFDNCRTYVRTISCILAL